MATDIPALSANAQSVLSALESKSITPLERGKLKMDIDTSPTLSAEFEAHHRALERRFGRDYELANENKLKSRLAPEDHERIGEIMRPSRILRENNMKIQEAKWSVEAQQSQGLTFGR